MQKVESDGINISRRKILKSVAGISSGIIGVGALPAYGDGEESIKPKNMNISVVSYSMREALLKGEMDLFGFIDWCAGIDSRGVELNSYYFRENFDKKYIHDLRKRAFDNGITVSSTSMGNNFCLAPGKERDAQIDYARIWIDNAAELFAPHIRIFSGDLPEKGDFNTYRGWVADCLNLVVPYAAERGIVLGLENHGGLTAKADDHLNLFRSVPQSPWFGINLDTCNYIVDVYNEIAKTAEYAVNVHIKTEVFDDSAIKVPADLQKIRDILSNASYKGWIALEYEAKGNPKIAIPRTVKKLKEIFES